MKQTGNWQFCCYLLIVLLILTSCDPLSLGISGGNNKMNGNFEIVKNGLPVNWYYYAPQTVPNSDFIIISDTTQYKEGKRSLNFQIRKCGNIGGRFSPGFFQDFKAMPNETYKVSFWIINEGCKFKVYLESSKKGAKDAGRSEVILQTQDTISEWKYFEFYFKIPSSIDIIRFESNILSPGNIWFDDIKIEGVTDKSERTLWIEMR